jgi:hypothetical protein
LAKLAPLAESTTPGLSGQRAAKEIQRAYQIPDAWLHPLPPPQKTSARQPTYLLPMPAPYQHIIVCWDTALGMFDLFDTHTRLTVGGVPTITNPRTGPAQDARLIWYDQCESKNGPIYTLVAYCNKILHFYKIQLLVPSPSFQHLQPTKLFGRINGEISAVCCTWPLNGSTPPRLIISTNRGELCVYEFSDACEKWGQYYLSQTLGPLRHRQYGERSRRNAHVATTMCALPGGRVATSGEEKGDEGLVRIWHLDEPVTSEGIATVTELRASEHKGRKLVDLQLVAMH